MKYIFKTALFILISAMAFMSCEKMEDVHADYVKDGEIIYANVPDTLQTMPGRNRIQLKWLVYNGNNIQKSIVEWEDEGELKSQSLDVSLNTPVDSVYVTIDNLDEKSYLFYAYNIDRDGNRSVKKQVTGSAYGDVYESSLTNRPLSMIDGGGTVDSVVVTWGTPSEGYIGTEVTYENTSGDLVSKMLLPEENRMVIRGWKSEGQMDYRSYYIPEPNAIDTFMAPIESAMLPMFIEFTGDKIDKSNWEIVDFSTEEPAEANWGPPIQGQAAAAIDDDLGTFWHTQWDGAEPGYPHYITIDMKELVKISKITSYRRQGDNRGQTHFQLFTSTDGVNFTMQGDFDYDNTIDSQSYNLGNLPMARYVKYVATEGPNFFAFLAELDVYGQVAAEVDRTDWEVVDLSSEEPAEANWGPPIQGLVDAALDGDLSTFWHSAWDQSQPDYPHYFTIDMKEPVRMLAVEAFRRQGNGNGQTQFKIYTSNDGVNFEDQGTFDFDAGSDAGQLYPLAFLPEARYFKYEATEGPNHYAFLAEIKVYGQVQ
jgi:hypothetical protein